MATAAATNDMSPWDRTKGVLAGIAMVVAAIGIAYTGLSDPDSVLAAGSAGSGRARALGSIVSSVARTIGVIPAVLGTSALFGGIGTLSVWGSLRD